MFFILLSGLFDALWVYLHSGTADRAEIITVLRTALDTLQQTVTTGLIIEGASLLSFKTSPCQIILQLLSKQQGKDFFSTRVKIISSLKVSNGCSVVFTSSILNGVLSYNSTLLGYTGLGTTWANEMNLVWIMLQDHWINHFISSIAWNRL